METEEIVKRALTLLHGTRQTIPREEVGRGASSISPASIKETLSLRQAYRAIWSLSKDAPIEAYASAWREIQERERQVPPEVALRVLQEEAQGFYEKTGLCPFCGGPELYLPPTSPLEWAD